MEYFYFLLYIIQIYDIYILFSASFIISSSVAVGFSFRTALTALVTFALVNPSITSAVVASSTAGFAAGINRVVFSAPAPFDTLS